MNWTKRTYKANVAMGRWDLLATDGPKGGGKRINLTFDSKRNRLICFTFPSPEA